MEKLTLEQLVTIRNRLREIGERWLEIDVLPDERNRLRDEWNMLETQLADDEPD